MNKATKEVMDILEKVFMCPACMISSPEERWHALDKIMTTYAHNRSEILQEQMKQEESAKGK